MGVEDIIGVDARGGCRYEGKSAPERIVTAVKSVAAAHPKKRFLLVGEFMELHQALREKPENIDVIHGADAKYGAVKRLAEMTASRDVGGFYTLADSQILVPMVDYRIGMFDACAYVFPHLKCCPLLAELPKCRDTTRISTWYALDVGARTNITSHDYVMFAHIGRLYASVIGKRKPVNIALDNIGSEERKGGSALQQAYAQLTALFPNTEQSSTHFIGNVETDPCFFDQEKGEGLVRPVDVLVTNAQAGNKLIKTAATIAEFFGREMRYEIKHGSPCEKLGGYLTRKVPGRIKRHLNTFTVSQFPLSNRPVCKGHGTASEDHIKAGLEHLISSIDTRGTDSMRTALEAYAREVAVREQLQETKAF